MYKFSTKHFISAEFDQHNRHSVFCHMSNEIKPISCLIKAQSLHLIQITRVFFFLFVFLKSMFNFLKLTFEWYEAIYNLQFINIYSPVKNSSFTFVMFQIFKKKKKWTKLAWVNIKFKSTFCIYSHVCFMMWNIEVWQNC